MDLFILLTVLCALAWHAYFKNGWAPYVGAVLTSPLLFAFMMAAIGHSYAEAQFFLDLRYMVPIAIVGSVAIGLAFRFLRSRRKDRPSGSE